MLRLFYLSITGDLMKTITAILQSQLLHHVAQPIWNIQNHTLFGYECLLRSTFSINPEQMFQQAKLENKLFDLDTVSIQTAIKHLSALNRPQTWSFVNIYPSTIVHQNFEKLILPSLSLIKDFRIVFELNESLFEKNVWHDPVFKQNVEWLTNQGVFIAFDDISDLTILEERLKVFTPHILKLDRSLSIDLHRSKFKQQFVQTCLEIADDLQVPLVLEGIEHQEEFFAAQRLGIVYGQGYLLGKPMNQWNFPEKLMIH
jgi:EAL domain-containing protein (putative c-di-GMP-specific phosphodiesterase class I)